MNYDYYPRDYDDPCSMCNSMWAVTAQMLTEVKSNSGVWHGSKQLPTFYIQASSEPEARKKAIDILNPEDGVKRNFVIDVSRD